MFGMHDADVHTTPDQTATFAARQPALDHGHEVVMIAEDDAVERIALTRVLQRAGFSVVVAADGTEAVELAVAHRPDVMLLDAVMPDLGGFEGDGIAVADLVGVPPLHGSSIVTIGDAAVCPLCGDIGVGAVIAAGAGSWGTGRAVVLVGCIDRAVGDLAVSAEEVADACSVVLTERLSHWETDVERSRWVDNVVKTGAFDFVFQPIVDMRTGRVVAQEALVRFRDGTIPSEVFEGAINNECRVRLELALVESALQQAALFPSDVRVHVNVSPLAACAPELASLVANSERLVALEVTESALFSSTDASALRDRIPASCVLAADDVGSGYAGLSQLLDYRPDVLKIDRAVVTGVDADPARQALVAGLVQFARAIGSEIVAEGIERAAECQTLQQLGVVLGQGYHFARPAPLVEVSDVTYIATPGAPSQPQFWVAR